MKNEFALKTSIVYIVIELISGAPHIILRRRKREEEGAPEGSYNLPPTEESHNPYSAGTNPLPFSPIGSNGLPTFPYVHQFSQGLDVDPGDIFYLKGHLNIPVEGWGDMKGHLSGGPSHIWENYGHLLSPVDPLKLPAPDTLPSADGDSGASVQRDAEGGPAGAQSVPVASLPTGWTPVKCKPPFCNPYVHSFDTALQVEPGNDAWVDGGLDLPIKSKEGDHFPLDGSLYAGTMPLQVLYGHVITPVDPRAAENKAASTNRHGLLDFKRLVAARHETAGGSDLPPFPPHFQSSPSGAGEGASDILVSPPPIPDKENFPDIFVTPPPDTVSTGKEPFRLFQFPSSANSGAGTIANDYVPRPKTPFVLPPALP